ncbi:MAG: ATP-binding protein [Butyrivibrio sp.]|jgi:signal transduction histidine kinase|nr:ATP-binding protein [Butyrivibrio sp.]
MKDDRKKIVRFGACITYLLLSALLIGAAIGLTRTHISSYGKNVSTLSQAIMTAGGSSRAVQLPYRVTGVKPGDNVTLQFDTDFRAGDVLYVKTVYAPLKVYENGLLLYSYGEKGTYPSFFSDPATEVNTIELTSSENARITLVYSFPNSRSSMMIYAPLLGSSTGILQHLLREMGIPLAIALILMLMGILLALISAFLIPLEPKGTAVFWLGVFAFSSGLWTFSESNLTVFLTDNPDLLYLLAFLGLFTLPVPLLLFAVKMFDMGRYRILRVITCVSVVMLISAMILQLTGLVPFARSMYLFHVMIPTSICILAGCVFYEMKAKRNDLAKRFFIPFLILAICSVTETVNYQVHFTTQFSSIFLMGIVLFLLSSEGIAGMFIRQSIRLRSQNKELSFNLSLLEKQIDARKERDDLLIENAAAVKQQRHDLRHQMAVLRRYCDEKDYDALSAYIDTLTAAIPVDKSVTYCENPAVNAIFAHYAARAQKENIPMEIQAEVPRMTHEISDSNLCIIVGNLLENALEACEQITQDRRITFSSRLQGDFLFIAMDNSFNGIVKMRGDQFVSHKRDEIGTGLVSIRSVVEKAGGKATFEPKDRVFQSSVYFRI